MEITPAKKRLETRKELWAMLHDGHGKWGQIFNFILVLLILISVAILPLKFVPVFPGFERMIDGIEAVVIGIFTVEYFLRIYSAPKRLHYIFSFFGIVDLLSIVPFYAGIFGTEYIRILRVIRLLKIGEMHAGAAGDDEEDMEKAIGLVDGETVEYVVTKHPLFLFLHCIPPLVSLVFSLGVFLFSNGNPIGMGIGFSLLFFALIFLLKGWLDFNYDVIYLTNYRLVFHNQHLFGRSINQVNYFSITNVKPEYNSIMSFIFRFGSLDIETAADTPGEIKITMVRSHEKAAHLIMQKCFTAQSQHGAGNSAPGQAHRPPHEQEQPPVIAEI